MSTSYRNQSIDLHYKSIDWFLYAGNIGMKQVKLYLTINQESLQCKFNLMIIYLWDITYFHKIVLQKRINIHPINNLFTSKENLSLNDIIFSWRSFSLVPKSCPAWLSKFSIVLAISAEEVSYFSIPDISLRFSKCVAPVTPLNISLFCLWTSSRAIFENRQQDFWNEKIITHLIGSNFRF